MTLDNHPHLARLRGRLRTCAVTGTNGKTSTVRMVAAALEAGGVPTAWVTTTGSGLGKDRYPSAETEAAFIEFAQQAVNAGAETLVLEVTSRALAAGFADLWRPDVAVFTNLSHDHLDRHGSPEAYLAAKARLFLALPTGGTAILNRDDGAAELLAEVMDPDVEVLWFGTSRGDLQILHMEVSRTGTRLRLGDEGLETLQLPVVGRVHAYNAAAAALAARALGVSDEAIRRGLGGFPGVRGRFQIVADDPLVVVDFAHTPAALASTLETARELARARHGQLACVFGCGGGRDATKRPPMGAAADALCDTVWLTDDNPRDEDPEAIASAVQSGAEGGAHWEREPDRAAAIELAIRRAAPTDVVVIAGKGHEREQVRGERRVPFDDIQVAQNAHRRHADRP